MQIKVDGKITRVYGTMTFEELKKNMERPHLCSKCGVVACVGGRNLRNAAIKDAIKAKDGVYVMDCDDYMEGDISRTGNESLEESYYPFFECSIIHPDVKHLFIR